MTVCGDRNAWQTRDLAAWADAPAPEVELYSPIFNAPFRGRQEAIELFEVLFRSAGSVEITDELSAGDTEIMPVGELHAGFSSPGATPTGWAEGRGRIDEAEVFWLSTVRPDGRPHVTPLLAVWHDDAMYFCTGPDERKAKNLGQNPQCILTTGQNGLGGLDVVVEGRAVEVGDAAELEQVANAYESKYGARFTAPEGTWFGLSDAIRAGKVLLYRVTPTTVLGFAKGEQFSQTRWRFA